MYIHRVHIVPRDDVMSFFYKSKITHDLCWKGTDVSTQHSGYMWCNRFYSSITANILRKLCRWIVFTHHVQYIYAEYLSCEVYVKYSVLNPSYTRKASTFHVKTMYLHTFSTHTQCHVSKLLRIVYHNTTNTQKYGTLHHTLRFL